MKPNGVFVNGVYEDVLIEILEIQSELPEQILFLQPYLVTCSKGRDAPGRFVTSTNPISWTNKIEEAEIFDTFEKGIEASGGDITDWVGFRRHRDLQT